MTILGICGFQGAGKDTFANYLVSKYGFEKFSFASATKDVLAIIFGWNRKMLEGDTIESRVFRETVDPWWSEKLSIPELTPRKMLQLVGTDLFRKHFNYEIWTLIVEKKILTLQSANPNINIIVSDCRFPNEIAMLKKLGAKLTHIHRKLPEWFPDYKSGQECELASKLHLSETAWIRENFDYVISNEIDSIENFEKKIDNFLKTHYLMN